MNLTETQVNKITDAPIRSQHQESTYRSSNDLKQHPCSDDKSIHAPATASTTFSDLMPRPDFGRLTNTPNLAERRQKSTPTPVRVGENKPRMEKNIPNRPVPEAAPYPVSPLSPMEMYEASDMRVSDYSSGQHITSPSRPDPLRLRGDAQYQEAVPGNGNVMNMYDSWVQNLPEVPRGHGHQPQRSKSTLDGFSRGDNSSAYSRSPQKGASNSREVNDSPPFSPFPFYYREKGIPVEKRGGKTMIGEGGWLERTDGKPDTVNAKKPGILDGIKKMAKDITDFHHSGRRSKKVPGTQMAVSLDAREQSLLYCELEFHLTNSINGYIAGELGKGRLDTDKLKKISDAWLQQGRPKVVGFRYDLETQLDLVSLHIDEFVFHGRRQGNPAEIVGLLHSMKTNARAMRVRTFCHPDAVIARQLVDTQSLFNLLGVSRREHMALAEIGQFFKACIEREDQVSR
ncbi:unnamed protein product [Clonostachys rhizophaga]|uniref:Uncharacterized protein n=1 Tax=Clonostachys rhizophaga TaxID=160324 RepID=A0A9N9V494_9HYPO|nr:unnamed protein product [Clonostachys rhizophaga]